MRLVLDWSAPFPAPFDGGEVAAVVAVDEVVVPCAGAFEGTAEIWKRSKGRIWNNNNYMSKR
jgi:hypothetical protein